MFEIIGGALLLNWLFPRKEVYVVTKEPEVVYVPRRPIKEKELTKKEMEKLKEQMKNDCPFKYGFE